MFAGPSILGDLTCVRANHQVWAVRNEMSCISQDRAARLCCDNNFKNPLSLSCSHYVSIATFCGALLYGHLDGHGLMEPPPSCRSTIWNIWLPWSSNGRRKHIKISYLGASLVAQWLRIHLPMQGTWVWSLVWEDPTCRRATKPMHHNYWACALEPASHNYWACVPQLLKPARLEPVLLNKRSHCNEKPVHHNEE